MSDKNSLPHADFSKLQKQYEELTRLHQEHLSYLFDLTETKAKVCFELELAQIESRVYSGIKKIFK